MHHVPSSGASSAGVMVKAVMKRQEIEKKEETEEVFKGLGSLRKRPGNA